LFGRAVVCWGLLFGGAAISAAPSISKEYQVKAAFLYNFTKFVEWPKECFASPEDPIVICILGSNPFGEALETAVHERKVNGRPLVVQRVQTPGELTRASVLFVGAGEEVRLGRDLKAIHAAGILTVGETERFTAIGGVVTFKTIDDKVRFEINAAAAESARLKISAQLQKLATAVRRQP
jgi:hypothetical protein